MRDARTSKYQKYDAEELRQMVELRQKGFYLREIGARYGFTRERARQLLLRAGYQPKHAEVVNVQQAMFLSQYSPGRLWKLADSGKLPIARMQYSQKGRRLLWFWKSDIMALPPRLCPQCGANLTSRLTYSRRRFCSAQCRQAWRKTHRHWTEEQRQKRREAARRYKLREKAARLAGASMDTGTEATS